jgi:NADH:ubiquinone oxidoreductase subunit 6 (subunit J)
MLIFYKIITVSVVFATSILGILFNPLYSALTLMLIFVLVSLTFFSLNLEFLGLIFIMVYVGAIMVLFIFVILAVNIKRKNPVILYQQHLVTKYSWYYFFHNMSSPWLTLGLTSTLIDSEFWGQEHYQSYLYILRYTLDDLSVFGFYLYTQFFIYFLFLGIILLISLLSVIVIALDKSFFKSQVDVKGRTMFTLNFC